MNLDAVEVLFAAQWIAVALLSAYVLGLSWRPIKRIDAYDPRYDGPHAPPTHPNCRCVLEQRFIPKEPVMGYRLRAYDLAIALDGRAKIRRNAEGRKSVAEGQPDRLADQLEATAKFLRQEIVIGPRSADVLRVVLEGGTPTREQIREAYTEVGDIDDLMPF